MITTVTDTELALTAEIDELRAELTALKAQEPVARFNWHRGSFEWLTKYDYVTHNMKPLFLAAGAAPVQQEPEPMSNKPSDRILSFQTKRAIQAEDALHAAQKEIERLKSRPELTDAQILELWKQTYVQRGTSGIEFARAVMALAAGAAPVPNAELAEALEDLMSWQVKNVKRWHNSAYDNAARVLKKLEAGAAPAPAVPPGYVLVPMEPTPEMVQAAQSMG